MLFGSKDANPVRSYVDSSLPVYGWSEKLYPMEPLHGLNQVEHWEYAYNQCGNKESYVCPSASACDRKSAVGNYGWSE